MGLRRSFGDDNVLFGLNVCNERSLFRFEGQKRELCRRSFVCGFKSTSSNLILSYLGLVLVRKYLTAVV